MTANVGTWVPPPRPCRVWTRGTSRGYGVVNVRKNGGKSTLYRIHRVVYELLKGPISWGMQIDHLCRNRACYEIDHLRVVTPRENVLAPGSQAVTALNAAKTTCKRGHNNWSVWKTGHRYCQVCHHESARAWRNARRGAKGDGTT